MRVLVVNHVSLDGVFQGPGSPDEDTRGGFRHGGWAARAGGDPALAQAMGARMGAGHSWLLGPRSYDGILSHWNKAGGPFKDSLNQTAKYVASADPASDLPWPNSALLTGDVPAAVSDLRERPGGALVIMGSGQLVRSLLPRGLIDEILLMIHPLVLGSGQRLFGPGDHAHQLELTDSATTAAGVVIATYRPARGPS